jgi:alanine racemase
MPVRDTRPGSLTRASIHLDRLIHNLALLQTLVGRRPLWPAIKANAYGHGLRIVARHLLDKGFDTLCVAHVGEAVELIEAGIRARYILLSATLPEHSEWIVKFRCEPALCRIELLEALAREAQRQEQSVSVHLMVDTGMGRIGLQPGEVPAFLERCLAYPAVKVRGLMSHFPCADETDKSLSREGIDSFKRVIQALGSRGRMIHHMANSAAIFDLPEAHFDAVRPGIAIYGLRPSREIVNPRVEELQPVLEWQTRITFLKEVPTGTGLSYGHVFHTTRPSLIATLPVGYGDGLSRGLSNRCEMLVQGVRCPQVGRITMDQTLIDVTALRGRIELGEAVVIIGRQGDAQVTADELADKLGTINYEIVTAISQRVPRIVAEAG